MGFTRGDTADVYVALSNGSNSFGASKLWHGDFARQSEVPAVGDFNGDGKDDLVGFTRFSTGDVYVALSNGMTFGASKPWHSDFAFWSEAPAIGDVNRDGKADILTFARGSAGDVYVATSNGSSAFVGTGVKWASNFSFNDMVPGAGDFTGDGRADIVTFQRGTGGFQPIVRVAPALVTGTQFGATTTWHSSFLFSNELSLPSSMW